ncbi:cullin-3 [Cordyceps fumosorosea ARSEF 2679]|uniref:Cullin-3 n=1 Tax=Cordyceps fumosorosea (strain ARSEF 2679) TaxID=1081104 RepID=A0A162N1K2_CORFA|nr:cullin-3 [Cordyceps fumosorosea ARSEF 2679]OAA74039.1 cullin-3 [Cordyceps fumosorosea ARSEF 2679]
MLKEALRDIHNKSCGRLSFEELYRAAYKIVLKKKGDVLYDRVKEFEEQWFNDNVIPKIRALFTSGLVNIGKGSSTSANERRQTGERFLKGLRDTWEDHNVSMNMTADILMYLDRGYIQQELHRVPIFSTTIALFRDHILRSCLSKDSQNLVVDIVIAVMLDQIDMEREGDIIDRALIRSCSRMLSSLYEAEDENEFTKLYLTLFEPRFLENSQEFYRRECQELLVAADACRWLRHTKKRLEEEKDRCGTTIEPETETKIASIVDQQLIVKNLDEFLNMEGSGLRWLIDNEKSEELSILYKLVGRVDDRKTSLQTILQKRVVEMGIEIEDTLQNTDFSVPPEGEEGIGEKGIGEKGEKPKALPASSQQTAAAIKWVDDVLALRDKFDTMCTNCFQSDLIIQTALAKSFAEFINLFRRSSEYVSLFIDESMKKGIRGKSEREIDIILDKAIVLIRYLQDKDLFQTYYQRHLARRLLHAKSESHDVENQLILKMRQEFGQQFTSKLEGMFRDLVTSKDLTASYRDHIRTSGDGTKKTELGINVLTMNYWPQEVMGRTAQIGEGSRITCNYPPQIERLQASFEQFYLASRNGRKLTWIGTTGSADVRCTFPAIPGKSGGLAKERRYEINVPTYAMVVLMLFNDLREDEQLSFEEIQAKTAIATSDLMRTLTAIAVAPKSRVLLKDPPTKSIKSSDKFTFNAAFQSKTLRIKAPVINAVSKVEDATERTTTEEKNNETRAHIIDAAIVRIMKSRKLLTHTQLVNEVLSQLAARFKPEVPFIKRRIEDLISREYLERPDEDQALGVYRYVA